MNVEQGTVYSLLGPSGCGKTTLLNCLVCLETLTSGSIRLLTDNPTSIGYMPQEVSLMETCTTEETFHFFGTMYGLSIEEIKTRLKEINSLLHLPDEKLFIKQMSGGEQRRVSLAITLLHSPSLIILDEPTVGLDPLLRKSVWDHLLHLTKKEKKTILITTHYIEEARNSDKVGMMRNGCVLTEKNPVLLLESMNCTNLDNVFLQLCETECTKVTEEKVSKVKSLSVPHLNYNEYFRFSRFCAQLMKNYLWIKRSIMVIFLLLVLPVTQAILYCLCYGRYPVTLPVGLYTEEVDPGLCSSYPEKFYEIEDYNCTFHTPFSCTFAEKLSPHMHIVHYKSLEEGINDTYKNKIWGIIHIGSNFTQALFNRISLGFAAKPADLTDGSINVRLDSSSYIVMHHLEKELLTQMKSAFMDFKETCGIKDVVGNIPMKITKFNEGNPIVGAGSELCGLISGFLFYFAITFTSGMLMHEKTSGVMKRNLVAGMTFVEITLAHMVIQVLLLILQKIEMLIICYYIFEYDILGNIAVFSLLIFMIALVGVSLGLLIAVVLDSSMLQTYSSIGATLTLFIISGAAWPMEGMDTEVRPWLKLLPVIQAIYGIRAISTQGFDMSHSAVYLGFISNIVWILVFTLTSFIVMKMKKGY